MEKKIFWTKFHEHEKESKLYKLVGNIQQSETLNSVKRISIPSTVDRLIFSTFFEKKIRISSSELDKHNLLIS